MKKLHIIAFAFLVFTATAAHAGPRQDVIAGPVSGQVLDVLDGDTVTVTLQVWIGQRVETAVRIAGIDTPEIKGKCQKERDMAKAARAEVERLLQGGDIVLSDIRLEKYAGRVMAHAATAKGTDIATHLIEKGYARPYAGKKRAGWCGV